MSLCWSLSHFSRISYVFPIHKWVLSLSHGVLHLLFGSALQRLWLSLGYTVLRISFSLYYIHFLKSLYNLGHQFVPLTLQVPLHLILFFIILFLTAYWIYILAIYSVSQKIITFRSSIDVSSGLNTCPLLISLSLSFCSVILVWFLCHLFILVMLMHFVIVFILFLYSLCTTHRLSLFTLKFALSHKIVFRAKHFMFYLLFRYKGFNWTEKGQLEAVHRFY